MKIKVCGMRDPLNINEVVALEPDYLGFIFYRKSARFVDVTKLEEFLPLLPSSIERVGVFVDEAIDEVIAISKKLGLSHVQLHGHESPEYCSQVQEANLSVIKVFHMDDTFKVSQTESYLNCSDLFLFDTKTKGYGGSGKHFDWSVLQDYTANKPFLLSGGVSVEDIAKIKSLEIPQLLGIDVNSRVEVSPGNKDIEKVNELILKTREG